MRDMSAVRYVCGQGSRYLEGGGSRISDQVLDCPAADDTKLGAGTGVVGEFGELMFGRHMFSAVLQLADVWLQLVGEVTTP